MEETELQKYRHVQNIAKRTMEGISSFIKAGVTEADIAQKCEELMSNQGVTSFWYHNVPALVLVGDRTALSVSGKDYKPTDTRVKEFDLVTIDLNPELDGRWGDYARSFAVIGDNVMKNSYPEMAVETMELSLGILFEEMLHLQLQITSRPYMTFNELYFNMINFMNKEYRNLDFHGNLGHSIAKTLDDRIYIEKGNNTQLEDVPLFTFEPHIEKRGGKFGFKQEDIYYFENGILKPL